MVHVSEHSSSTDEICRSTVLLEEGATLAVLAKAQWPGKVHIFTVNGKLRELPTVLANEDQVDVYPLRVGG